MRLSVAIVEDSPEEIAALRSYFQRFSKEYAVDFEMTCFESAIPFLENYRGHYDLILMDIGLPGLNGMDAAIRLRRIDPSVLLIFVTNLVQFAVRGYEAEAFDFVVKPISYSDFCLKMKRVQGKLSTRQEEEISIVNGTRILKVPTGQLLYVEVQDHRLIYHTTSQQIEVRGNLKDAESKLNPKLFVRCNNCYLVNLKFVKDVQGFILTLPDEELVISRSRRKAFIQALNDYLGGGIGES